MPAVPVVPCDGKKAARVFVGIPTYKRPRMVLETIESVRSQTYRDYRVIVSDNGSGRDATDFIERKVAELGDPRFTFYRQPVNHGEYGQGRFFFGAAQDDIFFTIIHDDDVMKPTYLEEGVRTLEAHPDAAFFIANAYGMDQDGVPSAELTARHLRDQGRRGAREGMFDVLPMHMKCGFAPISGTLFRKAALERSGFVDADCFGNYPFECNIFLRLGEIGAKAWFSPAELLGVRLHPGSLRNNGLLRDEALVETVIRLWQSRRFTGSLERRRRVVLSRFLRADALIKLRNGAPDRARASLLRALRLNWLSVKAWGIAPLMMLSPRLAHAALSSREKRD